MFICRYSEFGTPSVTFHGSESLWGCVLIPMAIVKVASRLSQPGPCIGFCFCAWGLLLVLLPGRFYWVLGTGLELPHGTLCSCAAVILPSLFCFKFL